MSDIENLAYAGDPYWVDVLPAGEFLGLADKTVLHSGPPIEYARMCPLHKRCMVNACYMEGWATSESEAVVLLERGEVRCEAAFDYATNGSGIGIITKSVPLLIVEDRAWNSRAGLFPAEGKFGGGFCGWGVYSEAIAANLKWMREELFSELMKVVRDAGGFPMKALLDEALRMGDELHSSQRAIDPLFTRAIIPYCLKCRNSADLLDYFATTGRFTHNFGQAASRALVLGLEKAGKRGFLTAAGGNGVEYGIKVAGSDKWYTAPSPMIVGPYLTPGAKKENQLPWIGDSSIVECRGWGGQLYPINPDFERRREGAAETGEERRREGAAETGEERRREGAAETFPARPAPQMENSFPARPAPQTEGRIINGGMMDVNGGWMGAGSTRMPAACFAQAREDGAAC